MCFYVCVSLYTLFYIGFLQIMAQQGDDCYFYFYSHCTKGSNCPFRHEPLALGHEIMCESWKRGACTLSHCSNRHMIINHDRSTIPCYWLTQPGGCKKVHCPFLHSTSTIASKITDDISSKVKDILKPLEFIKENNIPVSEIVNPLIKQMEEEHSLKENKFADLSDLEPNSSSESNRSISRDKILKYSKIKDHQKHKTSKTNNSKNSNYNNEYNSDSSSSLSIKSKENTIIDIHLSSKDQSPHYYHDSSRERASYDKSYRSLNNFKNQSQSPDLKLFRSDNLIIRHISRSRSKSSDKKKLKKSDKLIAAVRTTHNIKDRLGKKRSLIQNESDDSSNIRSLMEIKVNLGSDTENHMNSKSYKKKTIKDNYANSGELKEGKNISVNHKLESKVVKLMTVGEILSGTKVSEASSKNSKNVKVLSLEEIQREKAIKSMIKRQKEMASNKLSENKSLKEKEIVSKTTNEINSDLVDEDINFSNDELIAGTLSLPDQDLEASRRVIIANSPTPMSQLIEHKANYSTNRVTGLSPKKKTLSSKEISPDISTIITNREVETVRKLEDQSHISVDLPIKIAQSKYQVKNSDTSDDSDNPDIENKFYDDQISAYDINMDISNDEHDLPIKSRILYKNQKQSTISDLSDFEVEIHNSPKNNKDFTNTKSRLLTSDVTSMNPIHLSRQKIVNNKELKSNISKDSKIDNLCDYKNSSVKRIVQLESRIQEQRGSMKHDGVKSRLGICVGIREGGNIRDVDYKFDNSNMSKDINANDAKKVNSSNLLRASRFGLVNLKKNDPNIENELKETEPVLHKKSKVEKRELEIYRPPGATRNKMNTNAHRNIKNRLGIRDQENVKSENNLLPIMDSEKYTLSNKLDMPPKAKDWSHVKSYAEILNEKELKKLKSSKILNDDSELNANTSSQIKIKNTMLITSKKNPEFESNKTTKTIPFLGLPGEYIGSLNKLDSVQTYPSHRNTNYSQQQSNTLSNANSESTYPILLKPINSIENKQLHTDISVSLDNTRNMIKPALFIPKTQDSIKETLTSPTIIQNIGCKKRKITLSCIEKNLSGNVSTQNLDTRGSQNMLVAKGNHFENFIQKPIEFNNFLEKPNKLSDSRKNSSLSESLLLEDTETDFNYDSSTKPNCEDCDEDDELFQELKQLLA